MLLSNNFAFNHYDTHIWVYTFDRSTVYDALLRKLSDEERQKAQLFLREEKRRSYVISHAFMRTVLSYYLSKPIQLIDYDYDRYGKPFLKLWGDIEFNLSHSQTIATLSVTRNVPIGIDTENIRSVSRLHPILNRYFSEHEIFSYQKSDNKLKTFFCYWTQKEAFCKATGLGIWNTNIKHIHVRGHIDKKQQLISIDSCKHMSNHWFVRSFLFKRQNLISIAIKKSKSNVIVREWPKEI